MEDRVVEIIQGEQEKKKNLKKMRVFKRLLGQHQAY